MAEALDSQPSSSPSLGAQTILIVEDEPMVREFARRLLETAGYRAIEAASGEEALNVLHARAGEIDGVLLDLSLPGMTGTDLLSRLRAFAPRLPVIVHSGYPVDATSEKLAEWNIAGVLQKPYRAARLLDMARQVFVEHSLP